MKLINLTGQRFGKLTVIRRVENRGKHSYWFCRCACGKTTEVASTSLCSRKTQSCGCYGKERLRSLRRELTGLHFGRWLILGSAPKRPRHTWWNCICDCGEKREIRADTLTRGQTLSCGCWRAEATAKRFYVHGQSRLGCRSRSYKAWSNMQTRCFNSRTPYFKYYGGRGITMSHEWRTSFAAFFRDLGHCPLGHSLDRIDVNGNYEPGNCRWASQFVQSGNKRSNKRIQYAGTTLILRDWAIKLRIPPERLSRMLAHNLSMNDIFRVVREEQFMQSLTVGNTGEQRQELVDNQRIHADRVQ